MKIATALLLCVGLAAIVGLGAGSHRNAAPPQPQPQPKPHLESGAPPLTEWRVMNAAREHVNAWSAFPIFAGDRTIVDHVASMDVINDERAGAMMRQAIEQWLADDPHSFGWRTYRGAFMYASNFNEPDELLASAIEHELLQRAADRHARESWRIMRSTDPETVAQQEQTWSARTNKLRRHVAELTAQANRREN